MTEKDFLELFPKQYSDYLQEAVKIREQIREIRVRVGKPTVVASNIGEQYITINGRLCNSVEKAWVATTEELLANIDYLCHYSIYAFDEEIRRGYLTLKGGHRVGIVGQTVFEDNRILRIQNFSSLNYRISHQVIGVARKLLSYFYQGQRIRNVLVISPPGCGKTTLLRDAVRLISNGNTYAGSKNVCVVDERSEIGGCYMGIPQNDIGMHTDILDACPKAEGMMIVLRAMAPELIAVDEIGSEQDVRALKEIASCGCSLLATAHAESLEDAYMRPQLKNCLENVLFDTIIVLSSNAGVGTVEGIYQNGEKVF